MRLHAKVPAFLAAIAIALLISCLANTLSASSLSIPSISGPSNAIVDAGQYEAFNAYDTGGTLPYAYNFFIANSITPATYRTYNTAGANGITFQITTANDLPNSIEEANVVVTDASSSTSNSVYSQGFAIHAAIAVPTIAVIGLAPPSGVDAGSTMTFSANESGGSPPYTYYFMISNSVTNVVLADHSFNAVNAGNEAYSWTVPAADGGNTMEVNVVVTDSATANEVSNSSYLKPFAINPALGTLSLSPSSASTNSITAFTASWSGGTPTYAASLYSSATPSCNQHSSLVQQLEGITSTSATFSQVEPATTTYYCAFVSDNSIYPYFSGTIASGISLPAGVAFSPDGSYAYIDGGSNVVIVNTATNAVTGAITGPGFSGPSGVAFSPSGAYAYITNQYSNNVLIINTASNSIAGAMTAGFNSPQGVAISPSGTYAYISNYNANNVVIVNTATNTVAGSITSGFASPYGVAFSPSGAYAYVVNNRAGTQNVVIINTATNSVVAALSGRVTGPIFAGFSPSGAYADVATASTQSAAIINPVTNTVVGSITGNVFDNPQGVAIAPSGGYLYITSFFNNLVLIYDSGTPTANSIDSAASPNSLLEMSSITPSNSMADQGQYETVTAYWSGGTAPYTAFNWMITNSLNGNVIANALYSGLSSALASNSFAFQLPAENNDLGALSIHFAVTDYLSNSNSIANTIPVTTPLSMGVFASTNSLMDYGQYATFTAQASGGTSPYAFNFIISDIATGEAVNSVLVASSDTASASIYVPTSLGSDTLQANVVVTDSATTNGMAESSYTPLTFNAAMSGLTVAAMSNPTTYAGKSIVWQASWFGGTAPYAANWIIPNSITGNQVTHSVSSDIGYSKGLVTNSIASTTGLLGEWLWNEGSGSTTNDLSTNVYTALSNNDLACWSDPANNLINCPSWAKGPGSSNAVGITNGNLIVVYASGNSPIWNPPNAITVGGWFYISNTLTTSGYPALVDKGDNNGYYIFVDPARSNTLTTNTLGIGVTFSGTLGTDYSGYLNTNFSQWNFYIITYNSTTHTLKIYFNGKLQNTDTSDIGPTNPTPGYNLFFADGGSSSGSSGYNGYVGRLYFWNRDLSANEISALYNTTALYYSTSTFAWTAPGSSAVNTVYANVVITDSATSPATITSAYSQAVTIDPFAITLSPSASSVSAGQSVTFTNTVTGGTAPYTAYSLTANPSAGVTIGSNAVTFANAGTFNVSESVTDSAGVTVDSSNQTITVKSTGASGGCNGICSGGSGGGAGGGGGNFKPTTQLSGNGTSSYYYIYNLTQDNTVQVILNGTSLNVTENFINPASAGITVYGHIYSIDLGQVISLGTRGNYSYSIILYNVSYLPIIHTIKLKLSSTHIGPEVHTYEIAGPVANVVMPTGPGIMDIVHYGTIAILSLESNQTSTVALSASNEGTPHFRLPMNYTLLNALNISINRTSATLGILMHYACSAQSGSPKPFMIINGSWYPISPFEANSTGCYVSFSVPSDPIVALMVHGPNTSAQTTAPPVSQQTTTKTTTAIAAPPEQPPGWTAALVAAVIVGLAIVVVVYYTRNRGHHA